MKMLLNLLGLLTMATSNPDLVLETMTTQGSSGTIVQARLRNAGKTPLRVLLHPYYCQIEPKLYDAQGKEIEGWDRRATQGAPAEPIKVDPVVLEPGAAVELQAFELMAGRASASSGDLSWQLQDLASQSLQVEFTYRLLQESAARAAKRGADGVEVGEWTSPRATVATTTLTAKQVRTVLSERRVVKDAGAIPLIIDALEKAKDSVTREYAAYSLGELRAKGAAGALATVLLQDKMREVRITAACALTSIASLDALDALVQASAKDEDDLVRHRATEALAQLPDAEAVAAALRSSKLQGDTLRDMAKRHPADVLTAGARRILTGGGGAEGAARCAAVDLLAEGKGDGLRLTLILRSVRDADPRVRLSAVRAAAKSGNPRAVEPLVAVAGDAETGSEARSLLKDLTGEKLVESGEAWSAWWDREGKQRFKAEEARSSSWTIEDKPATQKDYDALLARLKSHEGWYCKETSEGGITGELMKDADGLVYEVKIIADLEGTRSSIRKKR